MIRTDSVWPRVIFSILLIVGLLNLPAIAYSQDETTIQDLIVNGGFEEGFQGDFGVGFGWGAFSNGEAAVGWSADTWDEVVVSGQSAQLIEIKNATVMDRYAGIYQTVSVVPGAQYKLTINGLIRSEEGDITLSDYGYRLQYAVDYNGGTAWELVDDGTWVELFWDEQPLAEPPEGGYRFDTFETTITAKSDTLTLFIRGWKKWLNKGGGIFNLDEISLVGPAPEGFEAPAAQVASVGDTAASDAPLVSSAPAAQAEHDEDLDTDQPQPDDTQPEGQTEPTVEPTTEPPPEGETMPETGSAQPESLQSENASDSTTAPQSETSPQSDRSPVQPQESSPQPDVSQLPVAGQGEDGAIKFIILSGAALLLVLFVGAIAATRQRG